MVFKSLDNEATDQQTRRNKPENKPTLKNIKQFLQEQKIKGSCNFLIRSTTDAA